MKKVSPKLVLRRETLRSLAEGSLARVLGGDGLATKTADCPTVFQGGCPSNPTAIAALLPDEQ